LRHGDEHQLVVRAVSAQDTAAFGELVRRHQSQVRNFLRKLTGDMATADDLSQDCFMHAWDKLQTFSGRGSFIGWLLKIAYTTFLQSKRKSKRYGQILEQVGHKMETEGQSFSVQSEEVTDLDKLLAVLDDEERAIMIMSYAVGLSHREISDATSMPVGTVKSVIFRGKQKIRTNFDIKDHQYG
jgi:RNA polymerase sigma-70 factor (ECF subfamily)